MNIQELREQELYLLTIEEKNKTTIINAADILYIECNGYLTTVYLINNEKVTSSFLLKQYEKLLHDKGFMRVNYQTLVNGRHIKKAIFSKEQCVIFVQTIPVQVSRRRAKEVKMWLRK
ncbi:MAG: LytTR family transcriptional regulator [Bacteroidetes bacterium]|nr:LytTR family transcriptional regulator [Bacteroidota bacterium]MCL2302411.1 LytTR family transcriptional regulator [Lentimicrobiaceae bacterium]